MLFDSKKKSIEMNHDVSQEKLRSVINYWLEDYGHSSYQKSKCWL